MPEPIKLFTFDEKTAREIVRYVSVRRAQKPNVRADTWAGRQPLSQFVAAKITGTGAVGSVVTHAWTEQTWDVTTGTWVNMPDGLLGYTDTNYLINNPDATMAIDDEVVIAMRFIDHDANDGEGETVWVKVGSGGGLPLPQYQYMVYQAVTQNQVGADWPRAHDLV